MKHQVLRAAAVVCAVILAGCSAGATTAPATPTPTGTTAIPSMSGAPAASSATAASPKNVKIGVVTAIMPIAFSTTVGCGAQQAGKDLGVDVTVQGPPEFSAQKQIPILQAVARSGVGGIIIDPTDSSALIAPLQEIQAQGITVITNDITLSQPIATAQFTTSNLQGGQAAAQYIGQSMSGQGKVLVISWDPGVSTSDDRIKGFADGIKAFPGLTQLPVQFAHNQPNLADQITEATIRANPDLVGIFATNDGVANGVATGLKNTHMTGKIRLVAYDADPQQVQQLKAGAFDALVAQAAFQEGYDAVALMTKILRGEVQKSDVQFNNLVPDSIITRENVDSSESQKLIYKTNC